MYVLFGTALSLACLCWSVNGHSKFILPAPRTQDSALKMGPCGGISNSTGSLTVLQPGPLTVYWMETIFHTGAPFRIALSRPYEDYFEDCILLNHIPHNNGGYGGQTYSITIQIPDINCTFCSLQLIQIMTDKIQYYGSAGQTNCTYNPADTTDWTNGQCGSNYHSCANVMLEGAQPWNGSLCSQPANWTYNDPYGTYVYAQEAALWNNSLLVQAGTPTLVETVYNNESYCGAVLANPLAASVSTGGGGGSGSSGGGGGSSSSSSATGVASGDAGMWIAIGAGALVVLGVGFFLLRPKGKKDVENKEAKQLLMTDMRADDDKGTAV